MVRLKLIPVTALLTLLIWVMADYSLSDSVALQVWIVPEPSGGEGMYVTPLNTPDEPYEVQVTGKKVRISQLKSREPVRITIPVSKRDSGEYRLDLEDELKSQNRDLEGVMVQSIRPQFMGIRVDREITVTMPIRVLRGTLEYEVYPVPNPAEVEVTIRETAYRQIDPAERYVALDPDEALRTAVRGELRSTPVPLRPYVAGVGVELDPEVVMLKYKLAEQLQELTLSAVPIKIESSLDIFNEYDVEVRDSGSILTQPITIRGRAPVIERINAGEIKVWGVVSLTAADKADPGRYRYLTPHFRLPEGAELKSQPEPIEFRLVPRSKSRAAATSP